MDTIATKIELNRPIIREGLQDKRETYLREETHHILNKMEETLYNRTDREVQANNQPIKPFWICPRNMLLSNIIRQLSVHSINNVNMSLNIIGALFGFILSSSYGMGDTYYIAQMGLSGVDFFYELLYQRPSPLAGQGLDYYLRNKNRV